MLIKNKYMSKHNILFFFSFNKRAFNFCLTYSIKLDVLISEGFTGKQMQMKTVELARQKLNLNKKTFLKMFYTSHLSHNLYGNKVQF